MAFKKRAKKAPETFHFEETGGAMGLAEEMRNLSQEIADSFDTRVARVAALRQETRAMLQRFRQAMKPVQHDLKQKAADLRRFLSNAEATRKRDFRTMHQGIRAEQAARNGQVSGMLSGFRRMFSGLQQDRQAAARHWRSMAAAMAKKRASLAR